MKQKSLIKIFALLISVSIVFTSLTAGGIYSFAEDDDSPAVEIPETSQTTTDESTTRGTGKQETTGAETTKQETTKQETTKKETTKQETTEKNTEHSTAESALQTEEDIEKPTEATTQWDPSLSREDIQKQLEAQRKEFEAGIAELEKKLAKLSKESKDTEEYINLLDEKIGYLNEELTVLDEQIRRYVEDIDAIELEISENQAAIDVLQAEVDAIQAKLDELNEAFQSNYEAYCNRMRAVYVSGNYGIFEALFTCNDISSFFTRFEMIRSVSKSDANLLSVIMEEIDNITAEESELSQKKLALEELKAELLDRRESLEAKKNSLSSAQEQVAKKKVSLAQDRAESDMLFADLTAKNGMYTEYRNEDAKVKEAVEKEIADLINGLITPEDVTLGSTGEHDENATTAVHFSDVYSGSDAVLNMTYPAPGHYTVSAGYPNYSNGSYHGGIDFPCPTGTKIVAAQSGVVISVKRLDTSYGYYVMIYHGTDAKGRTVVTLYAHNSQILVSVGDTVSKGQQIAKSGSTGNSTGPHCHFEIRINNAKTNPSNYLAK